jgi:arginine decarboxylase
VINHSEKKNQSRSTEEAHTILVVDSGESQQSRLCRALLACDVNESGYLYRLLYFASHNSSNPDTQDRLKELLLLDQDAERKAMLRLRGAVLNWDAVEFPAKICRLILYYYPHVPVYIVKKNHTPDTEFDNLKKILPAYSRVYTCENQYCDIGCEIFEQLDNMIDSYFEAPYWESLKQYSKNPAVSFHALPIGQGQSLSSSINDFEAFYGERHFSAETSLTATPLDTLLNPRGSIRQAQIKAAKAFGAVTDAHCPYPACGTRFVTNGTSTANSIVISAFVKPDDFVLLERSCHISHHYALAYAYVKPVFMQPFTNVFGISGPVAMDTIKSSLAMLLERENSLPRMIILTNPTFDGIFYRPTHVVFTVRSVLSDYWQKYRETERIAKLMQSFQRFQFGYKYPDGNDAITERNFIIAAFRSMVFLFDEAWSASAYFYPKLIEFTAMHSAMALARMENEHYADCIRFYSTQSSHKSLSAMRQGSMIHYRDPLKGIPEMHQAFEHSFRAHTTTSPSATIIASLDIARKQAQLEGAQLVDKSFGFAAQFRRDYAENKYGDASGIFFAISDDDMMKSGVPNIADLSRNDFFFDITRVTLSWKFPVGGKIIRDLLLRNSVQVNKYDNNSVLAIFNIGINESSVKKLRQALRLISEEVRTFPLEDAKQHHKTPILPAFSEIYGGKSLGYWFKNLAGWQQHFIDVDEARDALRLSGESLSKYISAYFITPYPPGYPILVPGQIVTVHDLDYLRNIGISEILGCKREQERLKILVYDIPD